MEMMDSFCPAPEGVNAKVKLLVTVSAMPIASNLTRFILCLPIEFKENCIEAIESKAGGHFGDAKQ